MTPESATESESGWPSLPTETEIYILPSGEIIVADLPAELAAAMAHLTNLQNLEYGSSPTDDTLHSHLAQPT